MQYGNRAAAPEGAQPRRAVENGTGAGQHGDLLKNLVQFARRLQAEGMLVTPDEAVDALRALDHIDLGDRREFYLGLRTVFTSRAEDMVVFDRVFAHFWRFLPGPSDEADGDCAESEDDRGEEGAEAESDGPAEVTLEDWGEAEWGNAREQARRG